MPGEATTAVKAKGLEGIEGWLLFPALHLVVVAFAVTEYLMEAQLPMLRVEILASHLALLIGAVVLLGLFFKKLAITPPLMIVFYVTGAAVSALEYVTLVRFSDGIDPAVVQAELEGAREGLGIMLSNAILWIPYFLASERVRNTFVE